MHTEQMNFCKKIRDMFPTFFKDKRVLDAGSLDINGNNRYLFEGCEYLGVDVGPGNNVDVVMPIHEYLKTRKETYPVIISTEMLEHDRYAQQSLRSMYDGLVYGGLLLLTAAGMGRPDHAGSSPHTSDYYGNISVELLSTSLPPSNFRFYLIERSETDQDIYFAGIKI